MTSYTNIFGGSPVQPSEVGYRSITTAVDVTLSWPTSFLDNTNVCARIIDVDATALNIVITMPAANEVATGQDVLFRNVGANPFAVHDNAGNLIITVNENAPDNTNYIYLTDNSTAAGVWGTIQFGAGTSAADAAALSGLGLAPLNSLLNTNFPNKSLNADYQVLVSDRASLLVWTGGSGTITLPAAATATSGFYIAINNVGSGSVTITTPDGKNIDRALTTVVDPTESSYFIATNIAAVPPASAWNTLGFGKDTFFQANVLAPLDISGAPVTTLSTQQSARLIQQFTGALNQNVTVEYPASPGQWYVFNNTTNAFTVTLKLAGIGAGLVIPQGEKLIIYSDGSEMYNTPTVSTSTVFGDGNVGAPGIAFTSQTSTGFYRISSGLTGYSSAGSQGLTFGGTTPGYGLGISTGLAQRFYNTANNGYVGFKALGALAGATALIWTLPAADATVSGQLLRSDAASVLSFTSAAYPNATTVNQILYSSATNTISGLATANNGTLITSAGGVPSISSTLPNAVQDNITRLGTIAAGVWNGTGLTVPFGGTGLATLTTAYGVVCAGTTATGNLQNAGAGTANQVFTSNGAAALPSWKAITDSLPAAVKVDQTTGTSTTVYVNPAVQQNHISSIKAFIKFFVIAGVVTTVTSYNCSIVRNSQGRFTVTVATPFATATGWGFNYSFVYDAVNGISGPTVAVQNTAVNGGIDPTTTQMQIFTWGITAGAFGVTDPRSGCSFSFFGSQ